MNIDLGCEPQSLPRPQRFYFEQPRKAFKPLAERLSELDLNAPVRDNSGVSWVFKSPGPQEIIARLLIKWQETNQWYGIDISNFLFGISQKPLPGDKSLLYHIDPAEVRSQLAALCRMKEVGPHKEKALPFLRIEGDLIYPTKKLVDELKKLPRV